MVRRQNVVVGKTLHQKGAVNSGKPLRKSRRSGVEAENCCDCRARVIAVISHQKVLETVKNSTHNVVLKLGLSPDIHRCLEIVCICDPGGVGR